MENITTEQKNIHFLTYIQNNISNYWDEQALSDIDGKDYTYGNIAREIEKLHILFEKTGLQKGDKVAICAKNSARWGIAFLAVTTYEAVAVPLLNDFLPESISNLTNHSESKILFTDLEIWKKLDRSEMPDIKAVFSLSDYRLLYNTVGQDLLFAYDNWETLFTERFPEFGPSNVKYPVDNFDKLCLINYTSGTTSAPKGVMLNYASISSNVQFGEWGIPHYPGEKLVSMLPMAHMYGLAFEFIYQMSGGCHVYFLGKIPSPRILLDSFTKVKPYMVITVPLVIEKIFKNSVFPIIEKPLIGFLMKIPMFSHMIKNKIRKKILNAFGGNLRILVVGGAAINPEVEKCMKEIKLPYTVGYGMTECGPLIGFQDWRKFKTRSCGVPVHRLEVKIDSEDPEHIVGEILVRGVNVMLGYYKNQEATDAVFTQDGWMRTGDLGLIDEKGNIFIKGRSKNMILSSNGQNIYPEEIEDKLNSQPYVVESVVVERDKKIVALVFPDMDRVSQEALDANDLAKLMEENRIKMNLVLPMYSRITKIELRKEAFEKTPKRSIKRFLYK